MDKANKTPSLMERIEGPSVPERHEQDKGSRVSTRPDSNHSTSPFTSVGIELEEKNDDHRGYPQAEPTNRPPAFSPLPQTSTPSMAKASPVLRKDMTSREHTPSKRLSLSPALPLRPAQPRVQAQSRSPLQNQPESQQQVQIQPESRIQVQRQPQPQPQVQTSRVPKSLPSTLTEKTAPVLLINHTQNGNNRTADIDSCTSTNRPVVAECRFINLPEDENDHLISLLVEQKDNNDESLEGNNSTELIGVRGDASNDDNFMLLETRPSEDEARQLHNHESAYHSMEEDRKLEETELAYWVNFRLKYAAKIKVIEQRRLAEEEKRKWEQMISDISRRKSRQGSSTSFSSHIEPEDGPLRKRKGRSPGDDESTLSTRDSASSIICALQRINAQLRTSPGLHTE